MILSITTTLSRIEPQFFIVNFRFNILGLLLALVVTACQPTGEAQAPVAKHHRAKVFRAGTVFQKRAELSFVVARDEGIRIMGGEETITISPCNRE